MNMKRMTARELFFGILIFAFALTSPASAIDQAGTGRPAPVATKKMGPSKMSETECGGLGGKVVEAVNICLSGKACMTKGEDQKDHAVCISKSSK
jgi:hypothetical protein